MNKKTVITILLTVVALSATAQVNVEVSESVELMSILSRTAGLQEYSMDLAGQYTKDTEAWFAPHKDHSIIAYYQGLHNNHSISYDAVMSMAVHLDINKGRIHFLGEKSDLEKRWKEVDVDDFVNHLNKFYADTRFHEFFEQHRSFYEDGLKSYEADVMSYFHQNWYARFYGTEANERFRIVIGFTYGAHNNGVSRQLEGQPKEVFAICGYRLNPSTGLPTWDALVPIHEFNHSFVNSLLDDAANTALMEKVGQKLFQFSQPEMERQAYGDWKIVINESIVRAAVYIYMLDNKLINRNTPNIMFNEMWRSGFHWMPELVKALRLYASKREQYKTLNDYYPEMARCLGKYIEDEVGRIQGALK